MAGEAPIVAKRKVFINKVATINDKVAQQVCEQLHGHFIVDIHKSSGSDKLHPDIEFKINDNHKVGKYKKVDQQ